MTKYLNSLDKIGLIELHPGNIVRHPYLNADKTHWGMRGALGAFAQKHFELGILNTILDEKTIGTKFTKTSNTLMSKKTLTEFNQAIVDVMREFQRRSIRERPFVKKDDLLPVGIIFATGPCTEAKMIQLPRLP